jgi:hypothetical protein
MAGNVDPAADRHRGLQVRAQRGAEQHLDVRHQRVGVAYLAGYGIAQSLEQARGVVGPPHGHGTGADRIFKDQRPAYRPGEQFADHGIAIGVGRAGNRHHRGQLRIAERRDGADEAGDDEAEQHARPGLLRGFGREHEDARTDHGADAEQGQLDRAQ